MSVLLVRHARAGERDEWDGDDRLRPLDERGLRQAAALASVLEKLGATRLVSSPYARCIETLEPAASRLGLRIEARVELAEGATPAEVRAVASPGAALCTHGDVIDALLPGRRAKKGSVWVLDDDLRPERYLPPPA